MAESYTPIPAFTPGNPITTTQLNQLRDNIQYVNTAANNLTGTIKDESGKIVRVSNRMAAGKYDIASLKANTSKTTESIPFPTNFPDDVTVYVTLTIVGALKEKEDVDLAIAEVTRSGFKIWARSNLDREKLTVNFIAIGQVPTT